jgi:hypothetical protein
MREDDDAEHDLGFRAAFRGRGDETLTTKVQSSHAVRPGDSVAFDFKRGGVILFDSGTEEQIKV